VETITSSDASGWVLTVCSPIHRTSAAASAIDPLLDDPAEDRLALAWQVSDAVAGRHSRRRSHVPPLMTRTSTRASRARSARGVAAELPHNDVSDAIIRRCSQLGLDFLLDDA
jgi:hypothetical protein